MKKIEMHCHILPGIDDGAENMKQSLQMLQIAMDSEIVGAIVTPHGSARDASRERTEKIRKLCRIFQAKAEQQFDVIFPVFPGQEILYSSDARRLLDEGKLLTLADTRYVLVEFMPSTPYSMLYGAVREMRMGGYVPIMAHVERYNALREGDRLAELAEAGAKIQMNYSSVGGSIAVRPPDGAESSWKSSGSIFYRQTCMIRYTASRIRAAQTAGCRSIWMKNISGCWCRAMHERFWKKKDNRLEERDRWKRDLRMTRWRSIC